MQLGYIGLGKMGSNMVKRLKEKGYEVLAYDRSGHPLKNVESLEELVSKLPTPAGGHRTVWLMVPHSAVDDVLGDITPLLDEGDMVIDGGNSLYTESIRRSGELNRKGIRFMDVGVSGGPKGAREGACLMIGGSDEDYGEYKKLFRDIAAEDAYGYMGKAGAGHFVKMVHNGIEYGMMQAIGEGFAVMKESDFDLDLTKVADVYNHRSVIESRLIGWLKSAYEGHGEGLDDISGEVSASGEGLWTVEAAGELGVPVRVIGDALKFRSESKGNPSYTGQVVSALRNQFGGHDVAK